jgi:PhnB protein
MSPSVQPIPEGYPRVSPYLSVDGAGEAIDFYKQVLGATERMRMPMPDGKVGHAEIQIGNSRLMVADEFPEMGFRGPLTIGGSPVGICLYVEDADSMYNRTVSAGAKVLKPLADQFYGDRSGTVVDPFGHVWTIATHKEDVSPEEMKRRMEASKKEKK